LYRAILHLLLLLFLHPPRSTLFPYTTLFRSVRVEKLSTLFSQLTLLSAPSSCFYLTLIVSYQITNKLSHLDLLRILSSTCGRKEANPLLLVSLSIRPWHTLASRRRLRNLSRLFLLNFLPVVDSYFLLGYSWFSLFI